MARFTARVFALTLLVCSWTADLGHASPLAYIANSDDGTLSIVDTDTNAVLKTLVGFAFPAHVAVNSAGTRLYMTSLNSSPPVLQVINTQTNVIIKTMTVPAFAGSFFTNLVLNPTQPFGYLGYDPDQIFVFDAGSNTPVLPYTVPVSGGDQIGAIAVNPSGTKIYATKTPSADISVLDAATGMEITTITGGGFAEVAVDPTGAFVYAIDETFPFARDEIIVSSTATNMVVDSESFPGCTGLRGLTFNASGTTLYAACGATNEVAVIDTATLTATEVPVGFVPTGTSLTPDGAFLYVTNQASNDVSVLDTATNLVVDTIPVGDSPTSIGKFIGPNFVCGNNVLEPGEGCDDGNVADGDACSSNCYIVHDTVVAAPKPIRLTMQSGATFVGDTIKVKVRNESAAARKMSVAVSSPCAGAFGFSNLGAGNGIPALIEGETTVTAEVSFGIFGSSNFQLNYESPIRCPFTLTSYVDADFVEDPTPWNNVTVVEVDIIDENQPEMTTVHETKILPVKTVKMKIKEGATSATKTVKFKVGNADYLPSPEPAGSHSVSLTASDGDCPPMTVGTPSFSGSATADVEGGSTVKGSVAVTISAADVTSVSKTAPARCIATVTAVGPSGDSVPSNDTTAIVINISDLNDF